MSAQIKQVAMRIKGLREISGETPEQLSKSLKTGAAEYKKYESGAVDIPISFLYEVARHFDVELTALLTGEEPRLRTYSIVRNGTAPAVDRRKEYKYRDLAYNFIGKKAEIFTVTVDPESPRKKKHCYSHPGQEFNFVLSGTLKVTLDGHELVLEQGDSLYFDSGKSHCMAAMRGKSAKFLAVIM
jgi:quercetin dioxygenase-like cupin family protein